MSSMSTLSAYPRSQGDKRRKADFAPGQLEANLIVPGTGKALTAEPQLLSQRSFAVLMARDDTRDRHAPSGLSGRRRRYHRDAVVGGTGRDRAEPGASRQRRCYGARRRVHPVDTAGVAQARAGRDSEPPVAAGG